MARCFISAHAVVVAVNCVEDLELHASALLNGEHLLTEGEAGALRIVVLGVDDLPEQRLVGQIVHRELVVLAHIAIAVRCRILRIELPLRHNDHAVAGRDNVRRHCVVVRILCGVEHKDIEAARICARHRVRKADVNLTPHAFGKQSKMLN